MKLKKCIHNIPFGIEPTFGNNIGLEEDSKVYPKKYISISLGMKKIKRVDYWDGHIYYTTYEKFKEIKNPKYVNRHLQLNKIGFNLNEDSDTFECDSIKGRFKLNDSKYFLQQREKLVKIFKSIGIKPSSDYKQIESEGGEHYHISLKEVNKKGDEFKKKFLRNLYVFSINNPQLNWLFNNPDDNQNANSILNYKRNVCVWNHENYKYIVDKDYIPIIENPDEYSLSKQYSIIYREMYQTIEFRFLMMPRTQQEAKLHFNLVVSIYNHIWKITCKGIQLKQRYFKPKQLVMIPYNESWKNIVKTFKEIGLTKEEIDLVKKLKLGFMKYRYSIYGMLK